MSVTFHLYKVRPDVHYLGTKYDLSNKEERKNIDKLEKEEILNGFENDMVREYRADRFSDGQIKYYGLFDDSKPEDHSVIDVTWFNIIARMSSHNKGYRRLVKKLKKFSFDIVNHYYGYTNKYIVVDEILYRQGWFLRKKFFNKECTHYIATTKEEMICFFRKYLIEDERGKETFNSFLKEWDKNCSNELIFEVAF